MKETLRSIVVIGLAAILAVACRPASPTQTVSPTLAISAGQEAILFFSEREGDQHLYLMTPDGSGVQRLDFELPPATFFDLPCWAPQLDKFLVSVANQTRSDSDIYLVERNGRNPINLTNNPGSFETNPVISPDGQHIAYVAVELDLDVKVMDVNGHNPINITNLPTREIAPQWFPDSHRLLLVSNLEGTPNIYTVQRDGTGLTNISKGPGEDSSPSLSSDGRRVVFHSDRAGNADIFVVDADGQNLINLTQNPSADTEPLWSPDGTKIMFRSDRDGGPDIFVMQADGSTAVNLTKSPEVDERGISWSPDSQQLLFTALVNDQLEIFVVGLNTPLVNLTQNAADDFAPLWIRF